MNIRLVETSRSKSQIIAEQLEHTLVIQGDGTDVDLLASEGIGDMDAFVQIPYRNIDKYVHHANKYAF